MLRTALINMPFAQARRPSLALAQLRSVLQAALPGRAECNILHLNIDFVKWFTPPDYRMLAGFDSMAAGVGDWFFSAAAFPDAPDNTESYFQRYPEVFGTENDRLLRMLKERRQEVPRFLDELIARYELDRYDLVGFTSMFQQNVASMAMARRLKEHKPGIVTAMGGANCETPMGQVIARNVEQIDYVFSGGALKTFPKLVGYLAEGRTDECDRIGGVFSKRRLDRALGNPLNEVGEELELAVEVPLDYDDYFDALDRVFPGIETTDWALMPFETSRGCWWGQRAHCTFCGLNGSTMSYRAMPPAKALAQFEKLFRYAPRVSGFEAVDNIMPKEYVTDVFPHLRSPKSIFYEVKADLDEGALDVLAAAGVRVLQPGIEALDTSTLKLMKKGTTASQNVRLLKGCLPHGMKLYWDLLVGFPGQGDAPYRKYLDDIPSLVHLHPPGGAHVVRFERFSPYFFAAKDYGLRLKPYPFYGLVYPFDEKSLDDVGYFFTDESADTPYVSTMMKWITPLREKVSYWRTRFYQEDGKVKPELRFEWREGRRVVYDSRSGEATIIELDAVAVSILDLLASPMPASRLSRELPDVPSEEVDRQVELLRVHRLVFPDGDRLLSLITGGDLPQEMVAPVRPASDRQGSGRAAPPRP